MADNLSLRDLLEQMVKVGASDLHLTAGVPPQLRVDGELLAGHIHDRRSGVDADVPLRGVLRIRERTI